MQSEVAPANMCMETSNIYKIVQLVAMKFISQAWTEMKAESVANCWRSTGIIDGTCGETMESATQCKEINSLLNTLVAAPLCMSLSEIMSADNDDIFERQNVFDVAGDVVKDICSIMQEGENQKENGNVVIEIPSISEQNTLPWCGFRVVQEQNRPDFTMMRYLRRLRRTVQESEIKNCYQANINA